MLFLLFLQPKLLEDNRRIFSSYKQVILDEESPTEVINGYGLAKLVGLIEVAHL